MSKTRTPSILFAGCLLASVVLAAGCRQDMHDAPRYDPLEASPLFLNGAASQPLVQGTVARGLVSDDTVLTEGKLDGQPSPVFPFAIGKAELERGQERYNVYCAPCHGRTGEGNGMVVQRGYRQAASFHVDRLRTSPPGYFFDVISNGFGVMPDYRAQIPAEDRWKIAAYIRALQISHNATVDDVPAAERGKLDQPAGAKAAEGEGHKAGGQE